MTRRRLLGALLPLLVLLAACSSSGSGSDPRADGAGPDADAGPPPGFAVQVLGPVSFSVPQAWQPAPTQAAPGVQETLLRAPAAQGTSAAVALAQLQRQPKQGAVKEAEFLLRLKRDVQRADNVRSEPRTVPGFQLRDAGVLRPAR